MRIRTAIAIAVASLALAVPSVALATSPTQDAYSGIAGQQQGGNETPSSGTQAVSQSSGDGATTESSGTLPFTGFEVGLIALVGAGLLGSGILLYRGRRRAEVQI